MKVLGLDLSTKTGWAVIADGNLIAYGLLHCEKRTPDPSLVPDYEYIRRAQEMAERIHTLICERTPDYIYIEATNAGRNRGPQKLLEMLHCLLLVRLQHNEPFAKLVRYIDTSAWRTMIGLKLTTNDKKNNKLVRRKLKRGKITSKHLSVRWANQKFLLSLKIKDHDIADALAVGFCGWCLENLTINPPPF